jgi:ribosomal protein S18 acetylase RimI-like enzyme
MRPAGSLSPEAKLTIVRRLFETDARAYRAILVEALILHPDYFQRHYLEEISRPLEDVQRQLANEIVLGAWIKDELLGIVGFVAERGPKLRHAGTIKDLYLKERFRRKGVAGLLFAAVLEYAARQVDQVELIVSADNQGAIIFFERFGFRMCGLMPRGIRIEREDIDTWTMVRIVR